MRLVRCERIRLRPIVEDRIAAVAVCRGMGHNLDQTPPGGTGLNGPLRSRGLVGRDAAFMDEQAAGPVLGCKLKTIEDGPA